MSSDSGGQRPDRRTTLRNPRLWLLPGAVVTVLMALLGFGYLYSILEPADHLHDFPVALVNQDEGETITGPDGEAQRQNFGDQIAAGIVEGIDPAEIDVREVGISEAERQLRTGDVYGAIVIPSDFSKRLVILGTASVVPGDVEKPVITVRTNPRTGTFATAIVAQIGDEALSQVNDTVGRQLTDTVQAQLQGPPPTPLAGASALTLAQPVEVIVAPYNPLPDGTANGLSAFYYTLLLLLAGFTGAMIVHTMVDARLGFVPTEYGPWYIHHEQIGISRTHTLYVKWGITVLLGVVISLLYMAIAALLGMPIDRPGALFLYGAYAIIAVGITAHSILALFGSAGMIINLILFIVLGLPSSGGTLPIEATPKVFGWLAQFEPMHQVYLGVRSILYFDAGMETGLLTSLAITTVGLFVGLSLGFAATRVYDRHGFARTANKPDSLA